MTSSVRGIIEHISVGHETRRSAGTRSVLIGLVGRGIGSSRSPIMHQREGERLGLRYTYALVDFDTHALPDAALEEVLEAAEAAGFAGLNVTHPFKQTVIAHLSELVPEAEAIRAVNTVVFSPAGRIGYNTDCWGFAESFRRGLAGVGIDHVIQFGAGGGGAAVAHALLELGARRLDVYDRDHDRAVKLSERLSRRFGAAAIPLDNPHAALRGASGVVNTTPVGMAKYPGAPFPLSDLEPRHWVADIVYFPAETELLRHARALGCRTLPGTGMAVFQAAKAFELFTGLAPDRDAMSRHFEAAA
jgi:shikimate dehydrogenase